MLSLKTSLLSVMLVFSASCFISATHQGWKKCYSSDVAPEKTLDVRFGFPRQQRLNCQLRMSINLLYTSGENKGHYKQLYNGDFRCLEMAPKELFVYKHNPDADEYTGVYLVCVENLLDQNTHNNTMFELKITQKFDPSLYAEMTGADVPLVESKELIEVEETIMEIRKTLSWCQVYVQEAQDRGDHLEKLLIDSQNLTTKITWIQIGFLMLYGVFWLAAVRSMYQHK